MFSTLEGTSDPSGEPVKWRGAADAGDRAEFDDESEVDADG